MIDPTREFISPSEREFYHDFYHDQMEQIAVNSGLWTPERVEQMTWLLVLSKREIEA